MFVKNLFPEGGMVGKRAVKSRFILSSLAPAYPPYKSWMKKKSSKSLKFNTPGQTWGFWGSEEQEVKPGVCFIGFRSTEYNPHFITESDKP